MSSEAEKLSRKLARRPAKSGMRRKVCWRCRLLEERTRLNLSLRDIERATGISNATLSQAERGTDLNLTSAHAIAGFFGLTIAEMWPERIK